MDKILETKEAIVYRFSCDCYTPAHAMDIEVQKERNKDMIFSLYSTPNRWRDRLKWCLKMIIFGESLEAEFVFREEDVPELLNIVELSCNTAGRSTSGTKIT